MLYEINREAFNAVIACAGFNDIRYFLNSFFVDTHNNCLVATNGHVLAKVPLDRHDQPENTCTPETHGLLQGFLFKRLQKPLAKKHGNLVVIDCENAKLHFPRGNKAADRELLLDRLDGVFPAYPSMIVDSKTPTVEKSRFGFNPEYVSKPARWAGFPDAKTYIEFREGKLAYKMFVTYGEEALEKIEITLMGFRE